MPSGVVGGEPTRPKKRRKLGKQESFIEQPSSSSTPKFETLLDGNESLECIQFRYGLYEQAWSHTEAQIQVRIDMYNRDVLLILCEVNFR